MTPTEIRIARRLATYMLEIAEQKIDFHFFQGIGLALAVVYEESIGAAAGSIKPWDLIQWAKDLPDVPYPRVQ